MTPQEEIERRILSGWPFTYARLSALVGDERLADRVIQKWRRDGLIEYRREGRATIWSLTDAGRALAAKGLAFR